MLMILRWYWCDILVIPKWYSGGYLGIWQESSVRSLSGLSCASFPPVSTSVPSPLPLTDVHEQIACASFFQLPNIIHRDWLVGFEFRWSMLSLLSLSQICTKLDAHAPINYSLLSISSSSFMLYSTQVSSPILFWFRNCFNNIHRLQIIPVIRKWPIYVLWGRDMYSTMNVLKFYKSPISIA
jgi:hypothetical protein